MSRNHALPMATLVTILVSIRNSSGLDSGAKVLLVSGSCVSSVMKKVSKGYSSAASV